MIWRTNTKRYRIHVPQSNENNMSEWLPKQYRTSDAKKLYKELKNYIKADFDIFNELRIYMEMV